jgi:hypothetical protein
MLVGRAAGAVVAVAAAVDDDAALDDVGAADVVVSLALLELSSPPHAAATRPTESASVRSVRDRNGELPLRRMR